MSDEYYNMDPRVWDSLRELDERLVPQRDVDNWTHNILDYQKGDASFTYAVKMKNDARQYSLSLVRSNLDRIHELVVFTADKRFVSRSLDPRYNYDPQRWERFDFALNFLEVEKEELSRLDKEVCAQTPFGFSSVVDRMVRNKREEVITRLACMTHADFENAFDGTDYIPPILPLRQGGAMVPVRRMGKLYYLPNYRPGSQS